MLKFEDEILPFGGAIDERDPAKIARQLLGYDDGDDDEPPLAEELGDDDESLWLLAPGDSHVQAFRFLDGLDGAKLDVRFKPNGRSGVRQYRYKWAPGERDQARSIWEEMSVAGHPGKVVWARLIRPGVPYEETAVS